MSDDTSPQRKASLWWRQIQPGGGKPDNAGLAQLRRVATPQEALLHPCAVELAIRLNRHSFEDRTTACSLAAVLSHVRQDSKDRAIAAKLGKTNGDNRLMSEVRFRTLMQSASGTERMTAFRRAIALLGQNVNVEQLAYAWLFWDSGDRGRRLRSDWMFEYVGATRDLATASETDMTSSENPTP